MAMCDQANVDFVAMCHNVRAFDVGRIEPYPTTGAYIHETIHPRRLATIRYRIRCQNVGGSEQGYLAEADKNIFFIKIRQYCLVEVAFGGKE